jgi:membrane protease YdiL (CAAX protease family)
MQDFTDNPAADFDFAPPADALPIFGAGRAFRIFFAYIAAQMFFQVFVLVATGVKLGLEGGDPNDHAAIDAALQFVAGPAAAVGATISGLLVAVMTLSSPSGPVALGSADWLTFGDKRQWAEGFGSGVALSVMYLALASFLYPPSEQVDTGPLHSLALEPGWRQILWASFAIFFAPVLEELLFRGVLFSGLRNSWGTPLAAVISSVVFVLLHYSEVAGYIPALAAISTLAVLTLRIRLRTGSIGPAIAAHFGYNLTIVAQALVLVS